MSDYCYRVASDKRTPAQKTEDDAIRALRIQRGKIWLLRMRRYIAENRERIRQVNAMAFLAYHSPRQYELRRDRDKTYPNKRTVGLWIKKDWGIHSWFPIAEINAVVTFVEANK